MEGNKRVGVGPRILQSDALMESNQFDEITGWMDLSIDMYSINNVCVCCRVSSLMDMGHIERLNKRMYT